MAQTSRRAQGDRRAPITWSPDNVIVEKILTYCEYEVAKLRRLNRTNGNKRGDRYSDAREAILERIYGNLRNVNHRAYPAEINFDTVASDLVKRHDAVHDQTSKAGYIAALEAEWSDLRYHFAKHFTKPDFD